MNSVFEKSKHQTKPALVAEAKKGNMKSIASIQIKPILSRGLLSSLLAAALLACGFVSVAADRNASTGNPGVLPPQSNPHGKTYGEWAAAWWQWVLSIPADRNPLTDSTGEFAGEGQDGPVWFVAGTFADSVERSFDVPAGKALFIPVFNWIFGSGVFDCDPTVPGVPCVVCDLQDLAAANTETAQILDVSIDGVPLKDVAQYRASSPGPFSIVYPEDSVVGVPAGVYFPQVTDGYWLMLAPLSVGTHEIRLHVVAPDTIYGDYEFDVIHHVTVTPGK